MPVPVWATNQVLLASDVNNWFVPKVGVKTSSTNYTTTTFAADPDLQVTLAASAVYEIRCTLLYSAVAATDVGMDFQWYGPSAASVAFANWAAMVAGATAAANASNVISFIGDLHTVAGVGGTPVAATWTGTATTSVTAGAFGLQFREHTAANTVTAIAGSVLVATRIG
jgi:hypothetical protein